MGFNERLGEHIRHVRLQKGLSLLDVQAASGKEFKASVLGAYERGERAISAHRLASLAALYRVPVRAMLPREDAGADTPAERTLAIDVRRLQRASSAEGRAVARYVRALQSQRGDWGDHVVTVRRDDLRALAAALDTPASDLVKALEDQGLLTRTGV